MAFIEEFKREWIRPFLFYGNNRLSLIGGAVTTASAMVLIGYWVVSVIGRSGSSNPYIGIIFELILPALFVVGLLLIFLGILLRRRSLVASNQIPSFYPEVSLQNPQVRHAVDFVVILTVINFVIVGTASYRGVAYMETPTFCGSSCHVMQPEATAFHISSHSGVACTECHVAPGPAGYVHAKVNGTKQMLMVFANKYPRPIEGEGKIPAASVTCLNCHNPGRFIGDKMKVGTTFGEDAGNTRTASVTVVHVGGTDSFGHLSGIHGAHMANIQYIASDATNQTIPWVSKTNADGSITEFTTADFKMPANATKRTMDCIDCHNRPAHSFETAEAALDKKMAQGTPSSTLPFIHKEGLTLLQAKYDSKAAAQAKIASGLASFYQSQYPAIYQSQRAQIDEAAKTLATIWGNNNFPEMNVAFGTYPNNIGHTDSPGCFRCHDGSHNAKSGASIVNGCSTCHNLLSPSDLSPDLATSLGLQPVASAAPAAGITPAKPADPKLIAKGLSVYTAQSCNACHGDSGKGTPAGGPLTSVGAHYDDAKLAALLAKPNTAMAAGGMTPLDAKPADLTALTAFLRNIH